MLGSIVIETENLDCNLQYLPKIGQKESGDIKLGPISLNFSCNIQVAVSEFGVIT